ncbi:hypothetical protein NECAME_00505 [Necator americanus]|uniref:Uncharacterized protein n=1 Tax=Necator americanus TaxID=51031 RepID=W2T5T7_NECAM|nr:hypothetical protein NECAME_00505 [Necator americanus]ETN76979.1 hypothetical protein NECAME_00505 [Necator americanus]
METAITWDKFDKKKLLRGALTAPISNSTTAHTHTLAKKVLSTTVDVSASNNSTTCTPKTSVTISQKPHIEPRALKTESAALFTDSSAARPHSDSALSATSTYSLPPSHSHLVVNHIDAMDGLLIGCVVGDNCLVSGTPQQDELPLPPNWAIEVLRRSQYMSNSLDPSFS